MTEAERDGLRAALALAQAGYADYAEAVLRRNCGSHGAAPARLLAEAGSPRAIQAIREALAQDA